MRGYFPVFCPLKIELKESNGFRFFRRSVHVLAIVLLVISNYSFSMSLIFFLAVALSLVIDRFQPINHQINSLQWSLETPPIQLTTYTGAEVSLREVDNLVVFSWIVLISIRPEPGIDDQWMILLPDMMDSEDWRRLQVMSRWSNIFS